MRIARRRFIMAGKAKLSTQLHNELYYRIPESSHESLVDIRDELGMLAQLTMRLCCENDELLHVSSTALAQCFGRLSMGLGEILQHCLAPSDYEQCMKHSRH
jgi:hypothetical protein